MFIEFIFNLGALQLALNDPIRMQPCNKLMLICVLYVLLKYLECLMIGVTPDTSEFLTMHPRTYLNLKK
jgi:hypothetical protein